MEKSPTPNQQPENLNEQESSSQASEKPKSFAEHMAEMKQLEENPTLYTPPETPDPTPTPPEPPLPEPTPILEPPLPPTTPPDIPTPSPYGDGHTDQEKAAKDESKEKQLSDDEQGEVNFFKNWYANAKQEQPDASEADFRKTIVSGLGYHLGIPGYRLGDQDNPDAKPTEEQQARLEELYSVVVGKQKATEAAADATAAERAHLFEKENF